MGRTMIAPSKTRRSDDGTNRYVALKKKSFWSEENRWPRDSAGKTFLFRAVLELGKNEFGEAWNGKEPTAQLAEKLPKLSSQCSSGMQLIAYWRLQRERPDLGLPDLPRLLPKADFTNELWKVAREHYDDLNEKSRAPRERFWVAQSRLFNAIESGKIKSYLRPKVGGAFSQPLDLASWNTEQWQNRFYFGQMNPSEPFSSGAAGDKYQYIFVDSDDLANHMRSMSVESANVISKTDLANNVGENKGQLNEQENLISAEVLEDFLNSRRWGLVPTLVWIATHDIAIAAKESLKNGYSPNGLAVLKAVQIQKGLTPNWPYDDLEKVWKQELAPAMAEGKISAFATSVPFSKLGGLSQNFTGVVFPPNNAPGAPLDHRIEDNNGTAAIVPNNKVFAHAWIEWHNLTFLRNDILVLWPEHSKSIAIWDFAEKKHPNNCTNIERMVTDIYASFWKGDLGAAGLKLLQDNGKKSGPETFDMLTRFDLAMSALGEKEFYRLGEQKAYEFLASWNMADYRRIIYHYAYQFVRGKSVESESANDNKDSQYKRGLCADEAELEQWYLNWPPKIVANIENQHNKKSILGVSGSPKKPTLKRGPKPKVDPIKFESEVHRLLEQEGTPDPTVDPNFRQSTVEKHMMNWHKEAYGVSQNRVLSKNAIESYNKKFTFDTGQ